MTTLARWTFSRPRRGGARHRGSGHPGACSAHRARRSIRDLAAAGNGQPVRAAPCALPRAGRASGPPARLADGMLRNADGMLRSGSARGASEGQARSAWPSHAPWVSEPSPPIAGAAGQARPGSGRKSGSFAASRAAARCHQGRWACAPLAQAQPDAAGACRPEWRRRPP